VVAREAAPGFARQGVYLRKLRCFTDGLALGGEIALREQLARLRAAGWYRRRCHPVSQPDALQFSLREQRRHFIPLKH
jgi:hypothetical protein